MYIINMIIKKIKNLIKIKDKRITNVYIYCYYFYYNKLTNEIRIKEV